MPSGSRGTSWVRPTTRAIDWTPLLVIAVVLLMVEGILGWRGLEMPVIVRHMALAVLSAGTVLGLEDPAQSLLQPVPTSAGVRLWQRLTLLVGFAALIAGLIAISAHLVDASPDLGLSAPFVALIATGAAVHAVAGADSHHRHEVAAAAIILWVAAAALPIPSALDGLRLAWLDHPALVTWLAVATTVGATRRRSA